MPFDVAIEAPALRRAVLIEALRQQMPKGFIWDYSLGYDKRSCGTAGCALGLAVALGLLKRPAPGIVAAYSLLKPAMEMFGLDDAAARRIFYSPETYGFDSEDWNAVTPMMVADELEKIR